MSVHGTNAKFGCVCDGAVIGVQADSEQLRCIGEGETSGEQETSSGDCGAPSWRKESELLLRIHDVHDLNAALALQILNCLAHHGVKLRRNDEPNWQPA
jgi:hypothetical protein